MTNRASLRGKKIEKSPYEKVLEQSAINAVLTHYQYTVLRIVSAFWNNMLNKTLLNRSL